MNHSLQLLSFLLTKIRDSTERKEREFRNMDGKKQMGSSSSSSSFTSDLFGSTESSASSSSGIFGSIFAPSSKAMKVFGRESLRSEAIEMKQDSGNQFWNPKPGSQEKTPRSSGGEYQSVPNNDSSPYYQEQRVQQPCHLSSSIYYGGQDVYSHPQKTQVYSRVNNEGEEDDSGSASRGNWWQGSLYY